MIIDNGNERAMPARFAMIVAAAPALQSPGALPAEPALGYDCFKTRVEPIFLKKRVDHARCYVCHSDANNAFKLEKLPAGGKF